MAISQQTGLAGFLVADKHPITSEEVVVVDASKIVSVEGGATAAVCTLIRENAPSVPIVATIAEVVDAIATARA